MGNTLTQWNEIKTLCADLILTEEKDKLTWALNANGRFSVKSLYEQMILSSVNFPFKFLWKINVPPKIRVFVWLLVRNSVLTKDNLLKRGWVGDSKCVFCGKDEMVDHIFLQCPVAKFLWCEIQIPSNMNVLLTSWLSSLGKIRKRKIYVGIFALMWSIWTCRNDMCFECKRTIDPFVILYKSCRLIESWSIVQKKEENQRELRWE